jgi:hypothetical protein
MWGGAGGGAITAFSVLYCRCFQLRSPQSAVRQQRAAVCRRVRCALRSCLLLGDAPPGLRGAYWPLEGAVQLAQVLGAPFSARSIRPRYSLLMGRVVHRLSPIPAPCSLLGTQGPAAGDLYSISWGARWTPPRSQVPSNVIKRAHPTRLGRPLGP